MLLTSSFPGILGNNQRAFKISLMSVMINNEDRAPHLLISVFDCIHNKLGIAEGFIRPDLDCSGVVKLKELSSDVVSMGS